jgi:hypothetical protein
MRLAKAGDYAGACPKLAESQRLEPSLGVQYYLADCLERVGRSASAWANFVEVANKAHLAGEAAKEDTARQRANELEPKLARLTVEVEDDKVPGLSVRRGAIDVGAGQWGVAVPIDPGSYELEASAPGYETWKKTIQIAAGAAVSEKVPALRALPAEATTKPLVSSTASPPRPQAASWSTQRTIAVVTAGASVAALATGGVLALLASNANKSSKDPGYCLADDTCTDAGLDQRDKALKLADKATVFVIVGGALAAGGAVIWLTAPSSHSDASAAASARVGFAPGALFVRGQF